MGKDLAERFPEARDTFAAIDEALGVALSRLMFEGPEDELTATRNTQPAILAHSAAVFAIVDGSFTAWNFAQPRAMKCHHSSRTTSTMRRRARRRWSLASSAGSRWR